MYRRLIAAPLAALVVSMPMTVVEQDGVPTVLKEIVMIPSAEAASLSEAGERLHEAVLSYDLEAVRAAIEAGAPIEAKGFGGATPALTAAQISAWDICLYLLRSGANAEASDEFGDTIPEALAQSRVAPGTRHHEAMLEVAELLAKRGLIDR